MSSICFRAKLGLFVGACAMALLVIFGVTGVAIADDPSGAGTGAQSGAQKIGVLEDVVIGPGESWENVVVVGGDVTVLGTVQGKVVVVGGDVAVGPEARVGVGQDPEDDAVVVVFGDFTVESGATVAGGIARYAGPSGWMGAAALSPDYDSWSWRSIAGWVWLAVCLAIAAVIVVAIAPRQVAFVRERVRHHFFSSLGWGALGALVAVPLITVLLIITLVGILLLVPWLGVVVPAIWLFGFVSVGAMVGRLILGKKEDQRGPLMLAAVLGVVILSILWWVPVAGGIILFLLGLVGFGATCVAVWDRKRRSSGLRKTAPAWSSREADTAPSSTVTAEPAGELPSGEEPGDQAIRG